MLWSRYCFVYGYSAFFHSAGSHHLPISSHWLPDCSMTLATSGQQPQLCTVWTCLDRSSDCCHALHTTSPRPVLSGTPTKLLPAFPPAKICANPAASFSAPPMLSQCLGHSEPQSSLLSLFKLFHCQLLGPVTPCLGGPRVYIYSIHIHTSIHPHTYIQLHPDLFAY